MGSCGDQANKPKIPSMPSVSSTYQGEDATEEAPDHVKDLDLECMSEEELAECVPRLRKKLGELKQVHKKLTLTNKYLCTHVRDLRSACPLTQPLSSSFLTSTGCVSESDLAAIKAELSSSVSWKIVVDDRYESQAFSSAATLTFTDPKKSADSSSEISATFKRIKSLKLKPSSSNVSESSVGGLNFKLLIGSHKIIDQSAGDVLSWNAGEGVVDVSLSSLKSKASSLECNPNVAQLLADVRTKVEKSSGSSK